MFIEGIEDAIVNVCRTTTVAIVVDHNIDHQILENRSVNTLGGQEVALLLTIPRSWSAFDKDLRSSSVPKCELIL